MTPKVAYTVGYEGAEPGAFIAALVAAGVTMVVDTRAKPVSRRPAYRREALRALLEAAGVEYMSRPKLGVPKRIRPLARGRRWLFEAAYRGVIARAESIVDETAILAGRETIALLCFEIDPGQCHRSLLAASIEGRAPIAFRHLRVGDREYPDDHPVAVPVVRSQDQMEVAAR
jgi:uncharacterized protein (DUF488 family)